MLDTKNKNITRLNIGAGPWVREGWATLDNPCPHYTWPDPPDISMDLTEMKPIPLEDGSVDLVFCSHLVEHLFDDQVEYLFDEVRRILRPGGVFRVTCPDADYYIGQYEAGQITANEFAMSFAVELGDIFTEKGMKDHIDKYPSLKNCISHFAMTNSRKTNNHHPERHVNWFDADKLVLMLRSAGFASCREARRLDSASPDMRDPQHFDYSHVYMSLFAEAVK